MGKFYSRRSFLYGLGLGAGAPLLLPMLKYLRAEESGEIPRRVVIVVEGNGIEPGNLVPTAAREALASSTGEEIDDGARVFTDTYTHDSPLVVSEADLSTGKSLGPLGEERDGTTLEGQAALLLGLSNKIAGAGHSTDMGALSSARSGAAATIDHVLGQNPIHRGEVPFDVVRLGIHGRNHRINYSTCATGPSRPAPIICDPTTAFNTLFGSVASNNGRRTFLDRRDLLDFANDDVDAALRHFSGSSREREKLEKYLDSIEELTHRHDLIEDMESTLERVAPASPDESDLYGSKHPLDRLQVMFDLATASLLGDLTRVVVIASGTSGRGFDVSYTSLDPESPGRHTICHESSGSAQYRDTLREVTQRHVEYIADMAHTLRGVPEGDGTMLDHTAIVYLSDNGEKHHSTAIEWPALVVGGSELGLETDGRCVIYPRLGGDNHRQLSNLFNTLGYAAGVELDEFGREGNLRMAIGPLSELYSA